MLAQALDDTRASYLLYRFDALRRAQDLSYLTEPEGPLGTFGLGLHQLSVGLGELLIGKRRATG